MLDAIIEILKNYGIFGFIFLTAAGVLYKYITIHVPIWSARKKNEEKEESSEHVDSEYADLKSHQIFSNINYIITVDIPHLELLVDKPNREMLFKDLLVIYSQTVHAVCLKIIEDDMNDWESDKWSSEITNRIAEIVINTEKTAALAGIPIEVIKIFTAWNMNVINSLRESVSTLSKSKLYYDSTSRTFTFLLMMDLLLITTLGDVERSISDLNGEISGLKYKSLILE